MIDVLQWAEAATEIAKEKHLPLVILGGVREPDAEATELAQALLLAGERFLHTDDLPCLVRAVYVLAVLDGRYASYRFCPGSAVIDPHGIVADQPGISVFRPKTAESDDV